MSRTVSFANGSIAIAYKDASSFGWEEDEDGNRVYNEFAAEIHFDDMIMNIKEKAKKNWPSFSDCNTWLGREDRAILENNLAYIGVSEYCGCVSVWLCPRDEYNGLQKAFCNRIKEKFENEFGDMIKTATFSNGEAIFSKKAAYLC